MLAQTGSFDFIIDTVSAPHDVNILLSLLKRDGHLVLVGLPPEPLPVAAFALIAGRKSLSGSMIGGIAETQEMLDYCAEHGIVSDIELILSSNYKTRRRLAVPMIHRQSDPIFPREGDRGSLPPPAEPQIRQHWNGGAAEDRLGKALSREVLPRTAA